MTNFEKSVIIWLFVIAVALTVIAWRLDIINSTISRALELPTVNKSCPKV